MTCGTGGRTLSGYSPDEENDADAITAEIPLVIRDADRLLQLKTDGVTLTVDTQGRLTAKGVLEGDSFVADVPLGTTVDANNVTHLGLNTQANLGVVDSKLSVVASELLDANLGWYPALKAVDNRIQFDMLARPPLWLGSELPSEVLGSDGPNVLVFSPVMNKPSLPGTNGWWWSDNNAGPLTFSPHPDVPLVNCFRTLTNFQGALRQYNSIDAATAGRTAWGTYFEPALRGALLFGRPELAPAAPKTLEDGFYFRNGLKRGTAITLPGAAGSIYAVDVELEVATGGALAVDWLDTTADAYTGAMMAAPRQKPVVKETFQFTSGVKRLADGQTVEADLMVGLASTLKLSITALPGTTTLEFDTTCLTEAEVDARILLVFNEAMTAAGAAAFVSIAAMAAAIISKQDGSARLTELSGGTYNSNLTTYGSITTSGPLTVTNGGASFTDAVTVTNASVTAGGLMLFRLLQPNMPTGGYVWGTLGRALSTNDTSNWTFVNAGGPGSVGNYLSLGLWGSDLLRIYGDHVALQGTAPLTVGGTVTAAAPTAPGHLTTKTYVDNAVATAGGTYQPLNANLTALSGVEPTLPFLKLIDTTNAQGDIPLRMLQAAMPTATGFSRVELGAAESANNCANWVFSYAGGPDSVNNYTTLGLYGNELLRVYGDHVSIQGTAPLTVGGTVTAATPTAAGHLATKSYVDSGFQPVHANLTSLSNAAPTLPLLNLTTTTSTAGPVPLKMMQASMASGSGYTLASLGAAFSANNCANWTFAYAGGPGSVNNYMALGLWGSDLMRIYGNQIVFQGTAPMTVGGTVTAAAPTAGAHLATKTYVDNAVSGTLTTASASASYQPLNANLTSLSQVTPALVGLALSNTTTLNPYVPLTLLQPNMTVGQLGLSVYIGVEETANNSGMWSFNNAGGYGSASNFMSLGMTGAGPSGSVPELLFRIYNDHATLGGPLTVSGTVTGATPTDATHLTPKAYVDSNVVSTANSYTNAWGTKVWYAVPQSGVLDTAQPGAGVNDHFRIGPMDILSSQTVITADVMVVGKSNNNEIFWIQAQPETRPAYVADPWNYSDVYTGGQAVVKMQSIGGNSGGTAITLFGETIYSDGTTAGTGLVQRVRLVWQSPGAVWQYDGSNSTNTYNQPLPAGRYWFFVGCGYNNCYVPYTYDVNIPLSSYEKTVYTFRRNINP